MHRSLILALFAALISVAVAEWSVTVAIKHQNIDVLKQKLHDVSHPASAEYGRHLSLEQVNAIVSPSDESIDAVRAWLEEEWCATSFEYTPGREFVTVSAACAPEAYLSDPLRPHYMPLPDELKKHADFISVHGFALRSNFARSALPHDSFDLHAPRVLALSSGADSDVALQVVTHMSSPLVTRFAQPRARIVITAGAESIEVQEDVHCGRTRAMAEHLTHPTALRFAHAARDDHVICIGNVRSSSVPAAFHGQDVSVLVSVCGSSLAWSSDLQSDQEYCTPVGTAQGGLPVALLADLYPPNTQRSIYGVPQDLTGTNTTNAQLVWGTGTYGYSPEDLQEFYDDYDVDNSVDLTSFMGEDGKAGGDNWVEATLDIQYVSGIGTGVRSYVVNTDNSSAAEAGGAFGPAFVQFSKDLAGTDNPPFLVSFSLGSLSWASCNLLCTQAVSMGAASSMQECNQYVRGQFQVCMYDDNLQIQRIDEELMKAGTRGVTFVAAAGDGGNHFSFGAFLPVNDLAKALNEISCNYTLPTYPASSPYVIGVGATQMKGNEPIGCSSQTGGGITGGCGFSLTSSQPDWQQSVVQGYLSKINQTAAGAPNFNATNRAYPDVSTIGAGVPIVNGGRKMSVGGTSASTPELGGMISLINDNRLNQGLSPLGFFNPRLYDTAAQRNDLFVDVTSGSSSCGTDKCCDTGFDAIEGWDVFTGFGQPVFSAWMDAFGSDS